MNPVHSYRGASFARWIVKHPVWSITLGLLFVAAPSVGFSRLTTNFTHTSFFYADDPLLLRLESFEKRFGNDEALVVVMHSPSGIFDVESATLLQELTKEMWQVHAVIRVDSLANFNWVHADGDDIAVEPLIPADRPLTPDLLAARRTVALEHEALPDYLVSKDGTVAMLYARIKPALDVPTDTEAVMTQTRTLLDSLRRGDHEFYVTGGPAVNFAFKESSNGDLRALLPFLYLMVILFLVVSFRRVEGVLLPLLVISFAVVFTMGIAGLIGVEIGTVTSILPQVLVAIGVANTVHILNSHFSATRAGMERSEPLNMRSAATSSLRC